jgi:hypothetical protein
MSKRSAKKRTGKTERNDADARLPGWPGYRTRDGRSGYDPIDTRTEAAHTAGTLLHALIAGETRNPLLLAGLSLLGFVLIIPLVITMVDLINGHVFPWNAWLFALITGIAGIAILINFIRNLIRILRR